MEEKEMEQIDEAIAAGNPAGLETALRGFLHKLGIEPGPYISFEEAQAALKRGERIQL